MYEKFCRDNDTVVFMVTILEGKTVFTHVGLPLPTVVFHTCWVAGYLRYMPSNLSDYHSMKLKQSDCFNGETSFYWLSSKNVWGGRLVRIYVVPNNESVPIQLSIALSHWSNRTVTLMAMTSYDQVMGQTWKRRSLQHSYEVEGVLVDFHSLATAKSDHTWPTMVELTNQLGWGGMGIFFAVARFSVQGVITN